ncbi:MAG: helix-turn-helix domain-containing protein [Mitsuokella sp.]
MNRIAQEAAFRLAVVRYAERHGPSRAAIKYRVSRMTVYRWRKRYDGTKESLVPRSRRPHHHPIEFDSFADFKRQLAQYNRICNAFPMRPLGWDSPNECLVNPSPV